MSGDTPRVVDKILRYPATPDGLPDALWKHAYEPDPPHETASVAAKRNGRAPCRKNNKAVTKILAADKDDDDMIASVLTPGNFNTNDPQIKQFMMMQAAMMQQVMMSLNTGSMSSTNSGGFMNPMMMGAGFMNPMMMMGSSGTPKAKPPSRGPLAALHDEPQGPDAPQGRANDGSDVPGADGDKDIPEPMPPKNPADLVGAMQAAMQAGNGTVQAGKKKKRAGKDKKNAKTKAKPKLSITTQPDGPSPPFKRPAAADGIFKRPAAADGILTCNHMNCFLFECTCSLQMNFLEINHSYKLADMTSKSISSW